MFSSAAAESLHITPEAANGFTPRQREIVEAYQRLLDRGVNKPNPRDITIETGRENTTKEASNTYQHIYQMKRAGAWPFPSDYSPRSSTRSTKPPADFDNESWAVASLVPLFNSLSDDSRERVWRLIKNPLTDEELTALQQIRELTEDLTSAESKRVWDYVKGRFGRK